jgi:hypothetical protein
VKVKVKFEFSKETKNTYCYKEISDTPIIGCLYIQKHCIGTTPVKNLFAEISDEGGNE